MLCKPSTHSNDRVKQNETNSNSLTKFCQFDADLSITVDTVTTLGCSIAV